MSAAGPGGAPFRTITAGDWKESIAMARTEPNEVKEKIREAEATGSASSIPKGFRKLRLGEILRRGDKFFDFDKWIATAYRPGTPITRQILRANGDYIRRKLNS